jgi:hypothetical protein
VIILERYHLLEIHQDKPVLNVLQQLKLYKLIGVPSRECLVLFKISSKEIKINISNILEIDIYPNDQFINQNFTITKKYNINYPYLTHINCTLPPNEKIPQSIPSNLTLIHKIGRNIQILTYYYKSTIIIDQSQW